MKKVYTCNLFRFRLVKIFLLPAEGFASFDTVQYRKKYGSSLMDIMMSDRSGGETMGFNSDCSRTSELHV